MSLFSCSKCNCIENTALCRYWFRKEDKNEGLCSACDPRIGKWHGLFKKEPATGMVLLNDGFLVTQDYVKTEGFYWRERHQGLKIIKVLNEDAQPAV